jgi:hypothetical protein
MLSFFKNSFTMNLGSPLPPNVGRLLGRDPQELSGWFLGFIVMIVTKKIKDPIVVYIHGSQRIDKNPNHHP